MLPIQQEPCMQSVALPFELVIFGGAGDLSLRKLMPSLFCLHCDQRLHQTGRIIAIARSHYTREAFLEQVRQALESHLSKGGLIEQRWSEFAERLDYLPMDAKDRSSYFHLRQKLNPDISNRIFYFATRSDLYAVISESLRNEGLADDQTKIVLEKRAEFYENVGALRDMLQNHLLQLLCMTAMEPPSRLDADSVRDEKVKVLRALKRWSPSLIQERVVRGQYVPGVSDGKSVVGYLEEAGVEPGSCTETFVALRVDIENWRWAGVPFYLRTGKRLAQRACEIVVQFKELPHSIFGPTIQSPMSNRLIFRLQPDEGIRLQLFEKRSGPGMGVRATELSLSPGRTRTERTPDAYERLLMDVIEGNQTLFVRQDELMAAWEWLDPVLEAWGQTDARPEPYTAGTWGPPSATLLLARDGRLWADMAHPVL